MADITAEVSAAIHETTAELDAAREVVRQLANDLADVVDIIEPALADQTKRIRQARMSMVDELRQISSAVRDLKETMLAPTTEQAIVKCERLLAVLREFDELRHRGVLAAIAKAFD